MSITNCHFLDEESPENPRCRAAVPAEVLEGPDPRVGEHCINGADGIANCQIFIGRILADALAQMERGGNFFLKQHKPVKLPEDPENPRVDIGHVHHVADLAARKNKMSPRELFDTVHFSYGTNVYHKLIPLWNFWCVMASLFKQAQITADDVAAKILPYHDHLPEKLRYKYQGKPPLPDQEVEALKTQAVDWEAMKSTSSTLGSQGVSTRLRSMIAEQAFGRQVINSDLCYFYDVMEMRRGFKLLLPDHLQKREKGQQIGISTLIVLQECLRRQGLITADDIARKVIDDQLKP